MTKDKKVYTIVERSSVYKLVVKVRYHMYMFLVNTNYFFTKIDIYCYFKYKKSSNNFERLMQVLNNSLHFNLTKI